MYEADRKATEVLEELCNGKDSDQIAAHKIRLMLPNRIYCGVDFDTYGITTSNMSQQKQQTTKTSPIFLGNSALPCFSTNLSRHCFFSVTGVSTNRSATQLFRRPGPQFVGDCDNISLGILQTNPYFW